MSIQPPQDVLIIARSDIQRVMAPGDYRQAVDRAFRAAAAGSASSPPPMHLPMARGGFHAKGASISLDGDYVALKVNGNFPGNPAELHLPTIQGAIILADGSNGVLLAILDSIEVTLRRTAAASALAAQFLARPDSQTLLLCGCGEQGRAHLTALGEVLPLRRWLLWDRDPQAAAALARDHAGIADVAVEAVDDLGPAALAADVIATCTTAREPFLDVKDVREGTFIAAVGADNPDKNEIAPRLMAAATVVTDILAQCAAMGDLRHALEAGAMTQADVHGELQEIVAGAKPGRRDSSEVIIFDSTGTGLQDVAAAAAAYERCGAAGTGQRIALGAAQAPAPVVA